jgi:hypothetical protein
VTEIADEKQREREREGEPDKEIKEEKKRNAINKIK